MPEKEEKKKGIIILKRETSGVERRVGKDTHEQSGIQQRATKKEEKKEK